MTGESKSAPAELTDAVWTASEIERGLRQLPALKARQAEVVVAAKREWDEVKLNVKLARAKSMIANKVDPVTDKYRSSHILEAMADRDCAEMESDAIAAEGRYRGAEVRLSELEDLYSSVRKAANLLVMEWEGKADSIVKREYTG